MAKKYGPVIPYEERLARRNYSFQTAVDNFIIDSEKKMLAVVRSAISDTVDEMQTPTAKGGKMRVDTGFLRSSGLGSLAGMPSGPGRGEKAQKYQWESGALAPLLAKMKIGDSFYWGWTANYAKYREAYDGFLESALMNWQKRVNAAVAKVKKRTGK